MLNKHEASRSCTWRERARVIPCSARISSRSIGRGDRDLSHLLRVEIAPRAERSEFSSGEPPDRRPQEGHVGRRQLLVSHGGSKSDSRPDVDRELSQAHGFSPEVPRCLPLTTAHRTRRQDLPKTQYAGAKGGFVLRRKSRHPSVTQPQFPCPDRAIRSRSRECRDNTAVPLHILDQRFRHRTADSG